MKVNKNKWFVLIIAIVLIVSCLFFFQNSIFSTKKSFSMAGMIIEEKHHYIEPGKYFEMWIIGYNANEKEENRKRYKIFIEESMVYNLIKEGEEYMIAAATFRKDEESGDIYKLEQISNQEEYQLAGKGRIK